MGPGMMSYSLTIQIKSLGTSSYLLRCLFVSQALKRSRQGMNWCSFLKSSPETFLSQIGFGAFFGSFAFEKCFSKKPESVPNCPPILWGSVL